MRVGPGRGQGGDYPKHTPPAPCKGGVWRVKTRPAPPRNEHYVCAPKSFFLSYTSTRVSAIRIIRIFPPPGTEESWDDISNLAPRRDSLLISGVFLGMKHVSRWMAGDGGVYSPSHRGAGQVLKKTEGDRLTPSTAVRLQDGRTAPLRTLIAGGTTRGIKRW